MKNIKAWHFVGPKMRDGRPVPNEGEKLVHKGEIKMCRVGLHASRKIMDALNYAPGSTICRVECGGLVEEGTDKLVCTERTILWWVGGEELLRDFARRCALDVIHLWDAPDVAVRYLKTGDESLRDDARAAARDAAWTAARAAARDDASTAARTAARDAAWAAARATAKTAARTAARDAARTAARTAAWAAARATAKTAARTAVWAAARDDVWAKQERRLVTMVHAARRLAMERDHLAMEKLRQEYGTLRHDYYATGWKWKYVPKQLGYLPPTDDPADAILGGKRDE